MIAACKPLDAVDHVQCIQCAALRYLARREYSRYELKQKLLGKSYLACQIDRVLDDLKEQDCQSDERFTEMYICSRMHRGDGPFKIKIALRQKGICDSLALAMFDRLAIDWSEQVRRLRQKKFGDAHVEDGHVLAKQMRYLKSKGFSREHIIQIFS